jgi:hypothetical protein
MAGMSYKVGACLVFVGACSLDVAGTGPTDPGAGAAPPADAAPDSSGGPAPDTDGAPADASTAEAAAPPDAKADAPPPPPPCDDLDKDGHKAKSCGGDDCCDNDARTHPGATDYYDTADACGSFDYDCNGKDETQYDTSASCQLVLFQGCQKAGFVAATGCGANAAFKTCDFHVIGGCQPSDTMQTQACR